LRAVDGVSFHIHQGETLGLVGESGSGKSTVGRLVLGLLRPSSGVVRFRGMDLTRRSGAAWRSSRRDAQMIFQNAAAALDPRMKVGGQLQEVLDVHRVGTPAERSHAMVNMLARVGLDAAAIAQRYPHQLSGGQRQRVVIARALAVEPALLVCDEPVSALDMSVQAQVINLLRDLQRKLRLTYLLISHDLRVTRHMSDRIAVMYLGRIVETAPRDALFRAPLHPYTRALISAVPVPDPARARRTAIIDGDLPSSFAPSFGCRFHRRCPVPMDRCRHDDPPLLEASPGHSVACHLIGGFQREAAS
jgi:oligopeptide/dipeptide ABC transporter ATP-binding protein